jgi:hypothetical protein
LIINLAISDLTVCFVSMPFTMLRLINHTSWNYGDGLCRLTRYLLRLCNLASFNMFPTFTSVLFIRHRLWNQTSV